MRRLSAVALAAFALVVSVAPAAAYITVRESGNPGYWDAIDQEETPGARCVYGSESGLLKWISIRPPLMYGYSTEQQSRVAWRFKIRRSDDQLNWQTVYTSSFQRTRATAADAGEFTRRVWNAPDDPTGFYVIRVIMVWHWQGAVEGRAAFEYEWYKRRQGSDVSVVHGYCSDNF